MKTVIQRASEGPGDGTETSSLEESWRTSQTSDGRGKAGEIFTDEYCLCIEYSRN